MAEPSFEGQLFLAGGGDADDSWPLDEHLVNQIGEDALIGYIPVAMPSERYPACEEWIRSVFKQHGLADIRTWTDLEAIGMSDLTCVSAVYIGGGNTYRLLDILQQTDTDQLLHEFVINGGLLYGGSAGAIICGETIETTPDENLVDLPNTTGLGFLSGVDIWCHYTEADDSAIHAYVNRTDRAVIAIPERSGISVAASRFPFQVVGHDPIRVFNESGKTSKPPGERYRIGNCR